jgi:hypothetical protein
MHVFSKKRTEGDIEFGMVYGGIAILVLCAAHFLPILSFFPDCVFHSITGLPCPTCGSTRAVERLAHGDFLSAIAIQPLTSFCFMAAVLYFMYSLGALIRGSCRISITFTDKEGTVLRTTALVIVLTNWLYLIINL